MKKKATQCSKCPKKPCHIGETEGSPAFCPMKIKADTIETSKNRLREPEARPIAKSACLNAGESKLGSTRIEDTVAFAKRMEYQKLGIAFCVALSDEAELLTSCFENNGFDVVSVCCMVGGIPVEHLEVKEEEKIVPGTYQPLCNPIGQAMVLNEEKTDLNIVFGLCVGDDTLFIRHSEAPITVFATKDMRLAHNPIAALWTAKTAYRGLNALKPPRRGEIDIFGRVKYL